MKALILFATISGVHASASTEFLARPPTSGNAIYQNGWIDFDKDGVKSPFEDSAVPLDQRVEDLLGRMTVDEKTCQLATLYGYRRVLTDPLPTPEWKTRVWKDGIANIDEMHQPPFPRPPVWPPALSTAFTQKATQPQIALRSGVWVYLPGQGSFSNWFGTVYTPNGSLSTDSSFLIGSFLSGGGHSLQKSTVVHVVPDYFATNSPSE